MPYKILYYKNYKVSLSPLVADTHGPETCQTYVILLVVYKRIFFLLHLGPGELGWSDCRGPSSSNVVTAPRHRATPSPLPNKIHTLSHICMNLVFLPSRTSFGVSIEFPESGADLSPISMVSSLRKFYKAF